MSRVRLSVAIALVLAAPAPAQSFTRGPSVWEHTDSSFLVAFQSSADAVGTVEWGPTPALGRAVRGRSTSDHAIRVAGLDPDRFYFYRVLLDGVPATLVHRTRTFPRTGSDVTFFVFGDCGSGGPHQFRVADLLNRYDFDLGILPGDIIYDNGEPQNFQPRFFEPYRFVLHRTPFFPVVGNHDIVSQLGAPFFEAFYLPTRSSGTERWFSFDHGDVHFIGLDSNFFFLDQQTEWLRADLAAARARGVSWIFVFFHHPPYSSGEHGPFPPTLLLWSPIFEEFDVDAVFCGHDHNYERTRVIRDFRPNGRGVVYYVVGTGGRTVRSVGRQPYSAFTASKFGFLKVEVRGNAMYTAFLDGTAETLGEELDPFWIRRGPVTPALRARTEHPTPGNLFRLMFDLRTGTSFALYLAARPGYTIVPGVGTWHLRVGDEILLQTGAAGPNQVEVYNLHVPADPSLQGVDLFFQGVANRGAFSVTDVLVSRVR